jgi:chaperonin GroEL
MIVPFLKEHAAKVAAPEELVDVATISANGDKQIAEIAVEAVLAAGEDGKVLIEEAQGNQLKVETIDGFIVTTGLKDVGAIGYAFINDKAGQQCKMDEGLVFLYDGTLNDLKIPAAIQQAVEGTDYYGKPIAVFAQGFSEVVLDTFAKTCKGGYMVVPVKTPMYGIANSSSMFLQDLAAYSGAKVYNPGTLSQFIEEDEETGFGQFSSAKINLYECFVTSNFSSEAVEQRVGELKAIAEAAKSDFDRMHIKAAIARLTGGVATIWVGGASELEAREKKARIEDAVEAVKSAIAEGIVPGGCAMQLVMSDMIFNMLSNAETPQSWIIMAKALRAPFELLLTNCGEDVNDVWMAIEPFISGRTEPPNKIFDANKHMIVDPLTCGIIEPAKVCRVSIVNAVSVASLLITLGGLVVVPRDSSLENQLALSKQAFKEMMSGDGVGQL